MLIRRQWVPKNHARGSVHDNLRYIPPILRQKHRYAHGWRNPMRYSLGCVPDSYDYLCRRSGPDHPPTVPDYLCQHVL